MKLSELIKELNKLKREHGDLEIFAGDPDYSNGDFHEVTKAVYHDGNLEHHCGRWLVCGVTEKPHVDLWHFFGRHCSECGRGCD